MNFELSASDLSDLKLDCLPKARESIMRRAKAENWEFKEVKSKGGKGGVKRVFKLPNYVIAEMKQKGLYNPANETQHINDCREQKVSEPLAFYHVDKPTFTHNTTNDDQELRYDKFLKSVNFTDFVPVIYYPEAMASAGHGALNYDNYESKPLLFDYEFIHCELRVNPANLICVPIKGDSMEPTICSGGMAMIDTSKKYESEGIYLIRQGEALKIKRLQQIAHDKMLIISDNKEIYSAIEIDLSETNEIEFDVLGKYLWHSEIAR